MKWSKRKSRISQLRSMVETQGQNGNWNYDPYMHGMFNGLELALALYEDRVPNYRKAPKEWLYSRQAVGDPVSSPETSSNDNGSPSAAAHDVKGEL